MEEDDFFERKEVRVWRNITTQEDIDLSGGMLQATLEPVLAWMYFHPPIDERYDSGNIVDSGFWGRNTSISDLLIKE